MVENVEYLDLSEFEGPEKEGGVFRVRALDELEIQGRSKNIKDYT
jgi:hypothetical protein